MPTLKEIQNRIQGVKNTQKITRAMKIVATTRLKKLERAVQGGSQYLSTLKAIYNDIAKSSYDLDHALLETNGAEKRVGIIIVSSDRGLCGSFNSQLFRMSQDFVEKKLHNVPVAYYAIGAKAAKHYTSSETELIMSASKLTHERQTAFVREVISSATTLFLEKKFSDVYLVFNGYASRSDFGFRTMHLLPFINIGKGMITEGKRVGSRCLIEPSTACCLDVLIPLFLRSLLADSLLQSQTAEELSRMLAMDYATENAEELMGDLTLVYNRTRQAVITKEISEIVGGAEALK